MSSSQRADDAVSRYNALSSLAPPSRNNTAAVAAAAAAAAGAGDASSVASSKRSLDDELASLASEIDEVFEDTEGEFEAASSGFGVNGSSEIGGGVGGTDSAGGAIGGGHLPNGAQLTGSDAAALIGAALSDDQDEDHVDNAKGNIDGGQGKEDEDVGYLHDDSMDDQVGVQEVAAALALAAAAAEEEEGGGTGTASHDGIPVDGVVGDAGMEPEPPLISQAVEEALTPSAEPMKEKSTEQSSQTYTSLTDIDPSHFRKPWEVPSRHSSKLQPDNVDGDARIDGEAASVTSASHKSIEDELASLASEMEEMLEEELAAELAQREQQQERGGSRNSMRRGRNNTFEDEGQVGANSSTAYLYQDEQEFDDGRYEVGGDGEIGADDNDGIGQNDGYIYDEDDEAVHNAVGTLWGGGSGGGPSSFTVNVPNGDASDPNFMAQYQHSQSSESPATSLGNGSAVGSVASSAASAISSTAQKAKTRLSKFTQNASMLSSQRVGSSSNMNGGPSSAESADEARPYIPPWQRKGANGSSTSTNAHEFAGPIGASMQMDLEQAAQIDAYRQGLINRLEDGEKVPSGAKGMGSKSKQAAVESYRRLIMQWILPIKVQVARQVRDGSSYVDNRLGCLSRLTGCSKQKIAFIFVAAGLYVTANIISNVEDGVRFIEKIGVKFGKASDAVFEVAEDSAAEAVDAAVNLFGGEAAGSPPPPNVLLPDYWEFLSDFEIPFHHVVPSLPGQRVRRLLQDEQQIEEAQKIPQPVRRKQQAVGIPIAGEANAAAPLQQQSDVPFFVHFPRSGGSTLLEIMSSCIGLVLASDVGARDGHGSDPILQVIETPVGSYVNVDTNSQAGLERAIELKLLDSGLVDVVSSNIPISALKLFEFAPQYRGKMFVLLRDPVERAASQFFELQKHEKHYARMSIEKYASSRKDEVDFNIMTKTLVDKPGLTTGSLTEDDLNTAKEILRRKAVVGLLSDKGDTVLRFERYFGWTYDTAEDKTCSEKLLHWEWKNKGEDNGPIAEDSEIYQDLAARNSFDMELYAYAVKLFKDQGGVLHGEEVGVE